MRRFAAVFVPVIGIALIITAGYFTPRFRTASLDPSQLAIKTVLPPKPIVDDCARIARAIELAKAKVVKSTEALSADETEIYRRVLLRWSSNGRESLNVSNKTYAFDQSMDHTTCECLSGIEAGDYVNASHTYHTIPRELLPTRKMRLVDRDSQLDMVKAHDPGNSTLARKSIPKAVDDAFANGLFSLSEIVFDPYHRRALVSYSFVCGGLCGSGGTLLFEKLNNEWRASDRVCGGWIS